MKKLLFTITIFISLTIVQGQTNVYHPFPDSNSCWNINYNAGMCLWGSAYENYSIIILGDTTISNRTYHKLITPYVEFYTSGTCTQQDFAGYKGAIRQDTLAKKVFYVPPTENNEQLLYDFTMQVGDTVKGFLEPLSFSGDTVKSIDSVLIGKSYHKRWFINPCYGIYFIEGFGSTYGLLKMSPNCATDMPDYSISCFQQNGYALYPDTTSNCQIITSINSTDPISTIVNVFPNPSNGSFNIDFDRATIKEVRLLDLLGNIIRQLKINNQTTYKIDNLKSGIYILTVTDKYNRTTKRKLISCP